jgi:hypothetical protein
MLLYVVLSKLFGDEINAAVTGLQNAHEQTTNITGGVSTAAGRRMLGGTIDYDANCTGGDDHRRFLQATEVHCTPVPLRQRAWPVELKRWCRAGGHAYGQAHAGDGADLRPLHYEYRPLHYEEHGLEPHCVHAGDW